MSSSGHKELLKWAVETGWTITVSRGAHLKFTHPEVNGAIYGAASPSDYRGMRSQRAKMLAALRQGRTIRRAAGVPREDLEKLSPPPLSTSARAKRKMKIKK